MEETEVNTVGEGLDPPGDATHRNSDRLLYGEVSNGQAGEKIPENSRI